MIEFLLKLGQDVINTFFTVLVTAFATFLAGKWWDDRKEEDDEPKKPRRKTTRRTRRGGSSKKRNINS